MTHHIHTQEFVVGAAVGSLLGGVAALFLAPKSGKRLRQDLCDGCSDLSEKTENLKKKGRSFAKSFGCRTCNWSGKKASLLNGIKNSLAGWVEEEEEESVGQDLLAGGLLGGVLGAIAGLLLAPKSGDELRQDIADRYEDATDSVERYAKKGRSFAKKAYARTDKWLDLAKEVVEELTDEAQDTGEEWIDKAKGIIKNDKINDLMDWALMGARVWRGLKSRR